MFVARSISLLISLTGAVIFTTLPWNDMFLWSLGVRPGNVVGLEHYRDFEKRGGGILVFNHPTFFDHAVLMQSLNSFLRFLVMKSHVSLYPLRRLCDKLGCITVEKGNTVTRLKESLATNKTIAVSPTGGESNPDQTKLPTFRTGAFVASQSILPVSISYFPYERWSKNETLFKMIVNRLCGTFLQYHVTILPAMTRSQEDTVEDFANRVKDNMEVALRSHQPLQTLNESPRPLLLASSLAFGLCSYLVFTTGKYIHAMGILIVFLTSVSYHSTGFIDAKFLDTFSNFALGFAFTTHGLLNANFAMFGYALVALVGFIIFKGENTLGHLFCVHIPVILGFLTLYL